MSRPSDKTGRFIRNRTVLHIGKRPGGRSTVQKNQYIIVPPHVPYSFEADSHDPWTIYWIHFCGKLTESFLSPNPAPQEILADEHVRQLVRIRLFEEIYSSFARGYIKEYLAYSSMCLYTFLSTFIFQEQFRHIDLPTHKENSFSMRVIYYLQEHVETNLTLKDLAEYFKYSESHFSTLFQKETGTSPTPKNTESLSVYRTYGYETERNCDAARIRGAGLFLPCLYQSYGNISFLLSEKRSR